MTEAPSRENVARAIADAAVLRGSFTLRSGRTSNYYIDKYLFSTQPRILDALGRLLAERIGTIAPAPNRLAGAELGGIPLVSVAAIHAGLPCVFVRNQKKDYGTAKQLEGTLEEGDTVVMLEDVATTGGQALEAANVIEDHGARVVAILAVIDREEGARATIEAAGYHFDALFTRADLGIED